MKYLLVSVFLFFALIFGAVWQLPDNKLHLVFCDVGQGDAILAIKGEKQILIDGGPSDKVVECLAENLPFWDREIELVVLTHPEYDHLSGLVTVLDRYSVKQILANSLATDTGVFGKFREKVIAQKIPVFSPKNGDKIKLGGIEMDVIFPLEKLGNEIVWQKDQPYQVLGISAYNGNLNQTAIVLELKDKNFKALLTGDIGIEQEKMLAVEPVDVLKIAHHGSKYSSSKEFLEEARPKLAIISVGAANKYGHPASEVLERLASLNIRTLRTDLYGEIEIVSDGESWKIRK